MSNETKPETGRARIVRFADAYRAEAKALDAARKAADAASHAGDLAAFVASLRDVGAKAGTLSVTAAFLADALHDHGVQPKKGA